MVFPNAHSALRSALSGRGYEEPTPVQDAVLDVAAMGRDLLVSAQTGSGKTVAYGLALADGLLGGEKRFGQAGAPLALVIAPTRELALQVRDELAWLYADTGARVVACVGGTDARREAQLLRAGCHIVVGTPGRLCDHVARRQVDLSALQAVVLDEADEMLDLGFREELETLLDATPETRRTLLFSATLAAPIAALARRYQSDALRLDVGQRNQPHADIEYRAILTEAGDIEAAVVNTLRYFEAGTALVFCATRDAVRDAHARLQSRGFAAVALSGEMSQAERTRTMAVLRDGAARVCVATDVAARGIDLPELALVIHAGLPMNAEVLLHRSGRTGRAGRKGVCVVVVPRPRRRRAEALLREARVQARWSDPPSAEDVAARDAERLLTDSLLTEAPGEADAELARRLAEGRTAEEIAAALIRLHRRQLPQPHALQPARFEPHAVPRADRPRSESGEPRRGRGDDGPMTWFSLAVGRRDRADPKWLVPLICRLGGVVKRDIGSIRIGDRETRFEIRAEIAGRFADEAVPAAAAEELHLAAASGAPPAAAPRRDVRPGQSSSRKRISRAA